MSNLESRVAIFEADVETTHDIVHGDDTTEVATDNGPVRSFAKLQKDLVEDLNAADTIAETQQNRDDAQQFRDQAEAARDAATVAGEVYTDTSAGLAATADGDYFKTPAASSEGFLTLYRNDGGSATEIETFPSLNGLAAAVLQANQKATRLARSLQRRGDLGQTLHSDFAHDAYGVGSRMSGGLDTALAGEELFSVSRAAPVRVWQPSGPNGEMTMTEVAPDTIARHWDPVTGRALGASVEPAKTNDIADSSGMSGFGFQRHERTLVTDIEGPTGDNVFAIERTLNGTLYGFFSGVTYQAGEEVSFSIFIRPNGNPITAVIKWWEGSGRMMDAPQYSGIDSSVYVGEGWYKSSLTVVADKTGDVAVSYNISGIESVGDICYITSPQLEKGKPTSYVPTSGSTVTRAGAVISRSLGYEYTPNGFSVYAEARQKSDIGSVVYLHSGGLDNSIRVGLPSNSGRVLFFSTNGNLQAAIPLSDFTAYTPSEPDKFVLAVDPPNNTVRLTINGQTVDRSVSEFPSLDEMRIGCISATNNNINGTVHDCIMYPWVLTASEAEAMTS